MPKEKPISLYPLKLEEALKALLNVKPPAKSVKPQRSSSKPASKGRATA